jgi:hypothetical protein
MKMRYEARIQDLGPGDFVKVECAACGHAELLASDQLRIKGQALPPYTPCSIVSVRGRRLSPAVTQPSHAPITVRQ